MPKQNYLSPEFETEGSTLIFEDTRISF